MAKKIVYGIVVDTKDAEGSIERLTDHLNDLNKAAESDEAAIMAVENALEKLTDQQDKSRKASEKAADANKKNVSGLKKLTRTIGTAIKALGIIGIILKVFQVFDEALQKNKTSADALSTATNAFNLVLSDVVNLIEPLGELISSAFNDPKQAVIDLWGIIKENLINRVKGMGLLFKGLGDTLSAAFSLDAEALKAGLADTARAFIQVNTGLDKAQQDSVANYVQGTVEKAAAITELDNALESSAARQEALKLESQKAAEEQRQIRDDESKSIEARLAANDKIAEILRKQALAERAIAGESLARAKAEIANGNSSVAAQNELLEAKNRLLEIDERLSGIISEQKTNNIALRNEALTTVNAQIDAETELANAVSVLESEKLSNVVDGINAKLQATVDAGLAETQAYRDLLNEKKLADIEYNNSLEAEAEAKRQKDLDIEQSIIDAKNRLREEGLEKDQIIEEERFQNYLAKLEEQGMLTSDLKLLLEAEHLQKIDDIKAKYDEKERQRVFDNATYALETAQGFANAAQGLSDMIFANDIANAEGNDKLQEKLREKQFKANKAIGIVNAVISTALAVVGQLSIPGPVGWVGAALAAVTGAIQIATIASAKYTPSGGGGGTRPAAVPAAPTAAATANSGPNINFSGSGTGLDNNIGGGANQPLVIQNNVSVSETEITSTQNNVSEYESASALSG